MVQSEIDVFSWLHEKLTLLSRRNDNNRAQNKLMQVMLVADFLELFSLSRVAVGEMKPSRMMDVEISCNYYSECALRVCFQLFSEKHLGER
mgnify:CR=1 FL=1